MLKVPPRTTSMGVCTKAVPLTKTLLTWRAGQTHWPLVQEASPVQAVAFPQRQVPVLQLSALLVAQAAQVAPAAPQREVVRLVTQTPLLQQPLGQEEALQTHWPLAHSWPVAQAGLVPHLQAPPSQTLAFLASQAIQAFPPTPQLARTEVVQAPWALQHPVAQVLGPQPQTWDCGSQAFPPVQATQATPFLPQLVLEVPLWQTPLASQQPLGQDVALQTHLPASQTLPVAQAMQAAPAVAHCALVVGVTQVSLAQQPFGQEVASQEHLPVTQRCPAPHKGAEEVSSSTAPSQLLSFPSQTSVVGKTSPWQVPHFPLAPQVWVPALHSPLPEVPVGPV